MSRIRDSARRLAAELFVRGIVPEPRVDVIDMGGGVFSVAIRGPDLGASHELGVPSSPAVIDTEDGASRLLPSGYAVAYDGEFRNLSVGYESEQHPEAPNDADWGIRNLQIASDSNSRHWRSIAPHIVGDIAAAIAQFIGRPQMFQREATVEPLTDWAARAFRSPAGMSDEELRLRHSERHGFPYDPIASGTPAYMHSLVSQISDATVERWITAWHMPEGSTRDDLAARVFRHGRGDETTPDEARELAAAIMADIGADRIAGARRADRSIVARHHDPDTAADLDHHDGTREPLEDSEWFRDLALATEKRQEQND